jgi:hypothetical protein
MQYLFLAKSLSTQREEKLSKREVRLADGEMRGVAYFDDSLVSCTIFVP